MSQVILLYQPDAELSEAVEASMRWQLTRILEQTERGVLLDDGDDQNQTFRELSCISWFTPVSNWTRAENALQP
jgi:hypothetical protein